MEIGVIGLGKMGSAIAERLIEAGHEVTVYNRTESKADRLLAKGALLADAPAGAAVGDIVITMLADDNALEKVMFGEPDDSDNDGGILAHQGEKTIHVSMSTVSPKLIKRIAKESEAHAKRLISAPVMGRPDVAERGELIVMAAGNKKQIEKCDPIFKSISKAVYVLGDKPEHANVAKLAANFMISSMIETFGEAFALLRKNDVDHHMFLQIMAEDFFASPIYQKYGKIIANEQFDGGAFTVKLQEKDTRLLLDCSVQSEVPMPFVGIIENAFLSAIGRGKGDLDPCAIAQLAAENAGVSQKRKKADN